MQIYNNIDYVSEFRLRKKNTRRKPKSNVASPCPSLTTQGFLLLKSPVLCLRCDVYACMRQTCSESSYDSFAILISSRAYIAHLRLRCLYAVCWFQRHYKHWTLIMSLLVPAALRQSNPSGRVREMLTFRSTNDDTKFDIRESVTEYNVGSLSQQNKPGCEVINWKIDRLL